MKLSSLIFVLFLAAFCSCGKENVITRPAGVTETDNANTALEDRACGTGLIQLRILSVIPTGYKPYLVVYDQDGSTRYVYPWACSNSGCTSLPCLDAADNNAYQTFTVDKCERIKVQLFEVDPYLYDCSNGGGSVTVSIKKNGTAFPVRTFTLTYTAGSTNWPSKCLDIDLNGGVGVPYTCPL